MFSLGTCPVCASFPLRAGSSPSLEAPHVLQLPQLPGALHSDVNPTCPLSRAFCYNCYFEIIVDLHAVVGRNTDRPCVAFTPFPPGVTSSPKAQCHNQENRR